MPGNMVKLSNWAWVQFLADMSGCSSSLAHKQGHSPSDQTNCLGNKLHATHCHEPHQDSSGSVGLLLGIRFLCLLAPRPGSYQMHVLLLACAPGSAGPCARPEYCWMLLWLEVCRMSTLSPWTCVRSHCRQLWYSCKVRESISSYPTHFVILTV